MRRVVSRGNDGCHTRHHLTGEQQKKKNKWCSRDHFQGFHSAEKALQ